MSLEKPKRKIRLEVFDLLRGFYIFGIIVNHLALFPNIFMYLTGATKLWLSFAEGFFLISGFFVGFLYRHKIVTDFWGVTKKITKRAFKLYLWTVYLTFVFTYWGNLMPAGTVKEALWIVHYDNLAELFFKAFTYQYQYGWADILPYYSIYLLITPFFLCLLSMGYYKWLILLSLAVWTMRLKSSYFAVQVIYFGGLTLGFYYQQIKDWWFGVSKSKRLFVERSVLWIFALSLLTCLVSVFYFNDLAKYLPYTDLLIHKNRVLNWYFDKQYVGPGRLILSPLWHLALLFIFSRYIKQIKRVLGWLLLVFGKNSLYSYMFHAFVIYPIPYFFIVFELGGFWLNSLVSLFCLLLVWIFTKHTAWYFKGKI